MISPTPAPVHTAGMDRGWARLGLAGVPVVVEADSHALLGRLADWSRQAFALTDTPATGPALRVAVRAHGAPPAPSGGAREVAAWGDWRMLCDGEQVFIAYPRARVTLHLAEARATLWLAETWWLEPLKLQQSPWLSLLGWLLRERGRYMLHASAVARDGKGLLLAGESGSGKSSSALALIQAGWDWLADDVALLEPGTGARIHGLARGFCFHPALAAQVPGLMGEPVAEKRFAAIEGLFPGRRVAACQPTAVLLPSVTGAAWSRLEPASPAEALLALLPASGLMLAGGSAARAQAHMQALQDLVSAVPAYRLWAGHDIFGNGAALAALLQAAGLDLGD